MFVASVRAQTKSFCEALIFAYIRGALLDTYSSTILRKNRFVMDHYGCPPQSLNCVQ